LGLDGYYLASFLDFASLQYISAGLERVILFRSDRDADLRVFLIG
jgi:hypothetical protein